LQPDGISDDQIELFEANLGWPGVRSRGLAHDVTPATLQTKFQHPRFETKPLGKTRKDIAEGIECAWTDHVAS